MCKLKSRRVCKINTIFRPTKTISFQINSIKSILSRETSYTQETRAHCKNGIGREKNSNNTRRRKDVYRRSYYYYILDCGKNEDESLGRRNYQKTRGFIYIIHRPKAGWWRWWAKTEIKTKFCRWKESNCRPGQD